MKPLIILLLSGLPLFGQLPYHPFRRVTFPDGKTLHFALQSIYAWSTNQASGPRPMPEWVGLPGDEGYAYADRYTVKAIWKNGLLIESHPGLGRSRPQTFVLKNYPGWTNLVDGERIEFLALRVGNTSYHENDVTNGTIHTVPMLDYGIPYNPFDTATKGQRKKDPSKP
jgi:hypothetical protein